ncbi:transposase [Nocardia sp. NPDC059239]|uniref:transposase n=1 Tax=Nocardia sp. NPDC059239 TaxID=3346785 RepID=UPI003692F9DF
MLAEIGDDSTRFTTANGLRAFAGTAPVTMASGRSHYVKSRKVRNRRLGDACRWWEFCALTGSQAPAPITTGAGPSATTTTPP